MTGIEAVALHEATRRRYLNYAMSVITSRALPDVRDGLKPVQRRILYGMFHNLRLMPEGRFRKSAAVVGEVMAKYHPHGDQAIYDAMVRMAQAFAVRVPLVDGHGNFGSIDGDSAAAMRYTECRLTRVALELLRELNQRTVDFRPTYDGQLFEPVILPARIPHLLVNGAEGIAVGMATRIPPHNLGEVIDACQLLIRDPDASNEQLCACIRGPDFPTGGVILEDSHTLAGIYAEGSGSIAVRGEWHTEKRGRKQLVIVTSIPWGLNKATLVEKIGEHIAARKVPQLLDVRDESTDHIRVVLELKRGSDPETAMAYLLRHTHLQQSYPVNLTALVPSSNPEVATPARLNLHDCLRHWLRFRFETVRRRFEFELEKLRERIHVLEGFEVVFADLDEAVRIIRESEGRRDAADRLMERFGLDDVQTDAILDLRLYRLSRLEILEIREELAERRARAEEIDRILASDTELWGVVRNELQALRDEYADPRRTRLAPSEDDEPTYRDDAYIVAEDAFVIATRDGWVKRQSSFTEIDRIRIREGDSIGWLIRASTRSTMAFFTDRGRAYVLRVDDIQATTGHGGPVQRHFHFHDGERVVGVISMDPRNLPPGGEPADPDDPPPPYGVAVTAAGRTLRFPLASHEDLSTRNGRLFARLTGKTDAVVAVYPCPPIPEEPESAEAPHVCVATAGGRALAFPLADAKLVRAAGKGVLAIKLAKGDRIMAFELSTDPRSGPEVSTNRGRHVVVSPRRYGASRAGRGLVVIRRGGLVEWHREPILIRDEDEPGEE